MIPPPATADLPGVTVPSLVLLSREFARLMGGDMTVASEVGVGSTFSVWLQEATG